MISIQQKSRVHTSTFGTRITAESYQRDQPTHYLEPFNIRILFVVFSLDKPHEVLEYNMYFLSNYSNIPCISNITLFFYNPAT